MRIHKEGTATLLLMAAVLLIINAALLILLPLPQWLQAMLILLSTGFYLFLISFFRNPKRNTLMNDAVIIAPADGKVVVIEETVETEYFHAPRRQVSIFMSPANVHVNRNPISGEVKYVRHHPGKFLVAWHPKSSTENERTTVVIANDKTELLMRQIAGILARRIVNYLQPHQKVAQGEAFGFIKFGSRVDLFLPLHAKIAVQLNQDVRGGETVIASID
ncbi:MAG: phosphatidylserine decarboxylase family protein [Chitinophagales bacterium]|nr:phosphatidylserine decarboxylase family protein [Chitinophagales bacterium]